MSRHVAILGAGIVGACVAVALRDAGFVVTIVDREEPGGEQAVDVGADDLRVERQAQPLGGALQALEVLVQGERPAAVEPDDLEDPVAAQQTLVGDGDHDVGAVADLAVQAS